VKDEIRIEPCVANGPAVLIIGSLGEDRRRLLGILGARNCDIHAIDTCREAMAIMLKRIIPVVICERLLPDGTWKDLLSALDTLADRPILIVTSKIADDRLWVEVLKLGGYDVLPQPFVHREVAHAVDSAWRNWTQLHQRSRVMKAGSASFDEKER